MKKNIMRCLGIIILALGFFAVGSSATTSVAEAQNPICTQSGFTEIACSYHSSNGDWYTKPVGELNPPIDITNYNFYNMNPVCDTTCVTRDPFGQCVLTTTSPRTRTTPQGMDYIGGSSQTYRLWCGSDAMHQSTDHLNYRHK